jgi:hypothetical protein
MPKFTGIRCEECITETVEGSVIQEGAEPFREILVANTRTGPAIYLGPCDPGNNDSLETHYLCSTKCLFAHITRLLKLDPVAQHR